MNKAILSNKPTKFKACLLELLGGSPRKPQDYNLYTTKVKQMKRISCEDSFCHFSKSPIKNYGRRAMLGKKNEMKL